MSTVLLESVLTDVSAESRQLDDWIHGLAEERWQLDTTGDGWTIAHQIGHLAWTDHVSLTAINEPDEFGALLKAAAADASGVVDAAADDWAGLAIGELLQRWRDGRQALVEALRSIPADTKIPWFGPPMSAVSMATARMMETWAHARDVAGVLGIQAPRDHRARHVADLGVRTRAYAYRVHDETPASSQIRIELVSPDGDYWIWGPSDADQRITGDGYDFALLATRRIHRDDADVHARGADADHWLDIIQAFAGQPGPDPVRKADR